MRELSFGARVSESFVEMLKREAANAAADFPGVLPRLCFEEKRHNCDAPTQGRIVLDRELESEATNRLFPPAPRLEVIERSWVIFFDTKMHPRETKFLIDGIEMHIDLSAQIVLKGTTLDFINGEIVATFDAH